MLKGHVCSNLNIDVVIILASDIMDVSLNYAQVVKVQQKSFVLSQRQNVTAFAF